MDTIRLHADLIQIPVLVLDHARHSTPKVDRSRFSITLDSGRPFRPTYVRPEGNDPINLSILLDVSDFDRAALPRIDKAIARLAPRSLHAGDRVTVYTLNCSLERVTSILPPDPASLRLAVEEVLRSWRSRDPRNKSAACLHPLALWDTFYYLANKLAPSPGRRVILAISSGIDHGSRLTWNQTKAYAQASGVSIFGVRYLSADNFNRSHASTPVSREMDPFNSVCELSGGIILPSDDDNLRETLERILQMIRERYIVEFPRPHIVSAGAHDILILIAGSDIFVRPGGISFSLPDPATFATPALPPQNPETTPAFGTRRILTPNQ